MSRPAGGFVLWVTLPAFEGVSASTRPLFEQARTEGIGFAPGHLFGRGDAYDNCLRLNAGYRWTNGIEAAIKRLGELAKISVAMPAGRPSGYIENLPC